MADEQTLGKWQKEFFQNKDIFMQYGLSEEEANGILKKFLYLCSVSPLPEVMKIFDEPERLNELGTHTNSDERARDFMLKFLAPILGNFEVIGAENIAKVTPFLGTYPVTIVSNHLSHLDAPSIYYFLYNSGPEGRKLAESLTIIAGRLAFLPDFTRLGLLMFNTLLVCSQKDISTNISQADLMTKINMRTYRHAQSLAGEGKALVVFPEGTRSRTGRLENFVDSVYHYVVNRIVLPLSLEGSQKILPASGSYLFNASTGSIKIGAPVIVGKLKEKNGVALPEEMNRIPLPKTGDKKVFIIDNLALLIGKGLHQHRHGTYRNLYKGDLLDPENNALISLAANPIENIVVLGHSQMGTAIAAALANKQVIVTIYIQDENLAKEYNDHSRDMKYYPFFKLPPNVSFSGNADCFRDATIFIQAESPWLVDDIIADCVECIKNSDAPIINVGKGLSSSSTGLVLSDLQQKYGIAKERLGVIAGAIIPYQLMERKYSGQEMAAYDEKLVTRVLPLFNTGYLYTKVANNVSDVIGVQLGSALKTMYAIGIGLLDGYFTNELGENVDNTVFHISNRFFRELKELGVYLGAKETTFDGLSGLSDFMLSCFGSYNLDRNYGFDFASGDKDPLPTHGLYSLRLLPNIINISDENFPILKAIYRIIIMGEDIGDVLLEMQKYLMSHGQAYIKYVKKSI